MTAPKKILFTIPNFITAGSGRAMLNIVERLDRRKFSPAVCVQKKGGDLDLEVEKMGIPFIEAPFALKARPYLSLYGRAKKAAEIFKPFGFKLWHSFNYSDDYTEGLVAHFSGARFIYTKKNMGWNSRAWFLRSLIASGIAAQNTDMMRDFFSGSFFRKKTELIPRGLDVRKFQPRNPAGEIRKSLGLPDSAVLAVCVAHLVPVKGHPTLLEALAKVPENVHLIIAGQALDAAFSESLHKLADELKISKRVHFLGGIKDVPALLSETDIFVLPTWAKWRMEGCPVALLEAMACGKACVATDIPGSRDIIQNEKNGFLVPPENAEAMAEKMNALTRSEELRKKTGTAARDRVLDFYTIERETSAHETLYGKVLGSCAS